MVDRIDTVKKYINEIIDEYCESNRKKDAVIHLYGVSAVCVMLAVKRGLDPDICAVSGLLHDIYAYRTGSYVHHQHSGTEMVRVILKRLGCFTDSEQRLICSAVFHHGDKADVHDAYDEVLKDADVLQPFLYSGANRIFHLALPRLNRMAQEFGLSISPEIYGQIEQNERQLNTCKAEVMANIAQTLAAKGICGELNNNDFKEIIKYWPEKEAFDELKNAWCASFVYHVCILSGIALPIKHPKCTHRFAGVGAWYEWSVDGGFFFKDTDGFLPQRGDIIIYDHIVPENKKPADSPWHDHIGIVTLVQDEWLTVAEGNIGNDNVSGLVDRKRGDRIGGYIRIPEDYVYDELKYDYKKDIIKDNIM
jgi:Predicted HD superfamily hydrolase